MTLTRLPVDTAFVALLRANLDKAVYYGDSGNAESGVPPEDAPLPYVVVYDIPGGSFYGPPLAAPEDDAEYLFQTTCVGGTAAQATWMDDQVRGVVIARNATGSFVYPLVVTGASIIDRQSQTGTSGATRTGKLWNTTPRFSIYVCGSP